MALMTTHADGTAIGQAMTISKKYANDDGTSRNEVLSNVTSQVLSINSTYQSAVQTVDRILGDTTITPDQRLLVIDDLRSSLANSSNQTIGNIAEKIQFEIDRNSLRMIENSELDSMEEALVGIVAGQLSDKTAVSMIENESTAKIVAHILKKVPSLVSDPGSLISSANARHRAEDLEVLNDLDKAYNVAINTITGIDNQFEKVAPTRRVAELRANKYSPEA